MPKAAREYIMSAFVWLDYSERERRKMLDVVDLFGEHNTRDELGIGSVRDAFADMMPCSFNAAVNWIRSPIATSRRSSR